MPKKITIDEFVLKSNKVHNNKYDYSKSVYVCSRTPLKIMCPIHGEFEKSPYAHVTMKCGCSKCFFSKKRNSTEEFIVRAKKVHGDKYDYSKVLYELPTR